MHTMPMHAQTWTQIREFLIFLKYALTERVYDSHTSNLTLCTELGQIPGVEI